MDARRDSRFNVGMLHWFAFERRWLELLLATMLPGGPAGLPAADRLDLAPFRDELAAAASPLLRFGLRASVWVLVFVSPLLIARPLPLPCLGADARDRALGAAAQSCSYVLRQCAGTIKVMACFAYFRDPAVRARFSMSMPA